MHWPEELSTACALKPIGYLFIHISYTQYLERAIWSTHKQLPTFRRDRCVLPPRQYDPPSQPKTELCMDILLVVIIARHLDYQAIWTIDHNNNIASADRRDRKSGSCSGSALWFKTRWYWDIEFYTFPQAWEGAKWASERTNERSGAQRSGQVKRAGNEWAMRANERTDKRVAQYLCSDSLSFQSKVRRLWGKKLQLQWQIATHRTNCQEKVSRWGFNFAKKEKGGKRFTIFHFWHYGRK